MYKTISAITVFAALLLSGCAALNQKAPETAPQAEPVSKADMLFPFECELEADECEARGSSTVRRTEEGLAVSLQATGLDPGAAYTVWVIVFGDPASCVGPCDGGDMDSGTGDPAMRLLTGKVVDGQGSGEFSGHLELWDPTGGGAKGNALTGITNLNAAEVHIVLRSHGEPIPGQIEAQISTFSGGCRQNGCVNQHYSIHPPVFK